MCSSLPQLATNHQSKVDTFSYYHFLFFFFYPNPSVVCCTCTQYLGLNYSTHLLSRSAFYSVWQHLTQQDDEVNLRWADTPRSFARVWHAQRKHMTIISVRPVFLQAFQSTASEASTSQVPSCPRPTATAVASHEQRLHKHSQTGMKYRLWDWEQGICTTGSCADSIYYSRQNILVYYCLFVFLFFFLQLLFYITMEGLGIG